MAGLILTQFYSLSHSKTALAEKYSLALLGIVHAHFTRGNEGVAIITVIFVGCGPTPIKVIGAKTKGIVMLIRNILA